MMIKQGQKVYKQIHTEGGIGQKERYWLWDKHLGIVITILLLILSFECALYIVLYMVTHLWAFLCNTL